eukprot:GHRQ01040292.1.p1 GENE.GHRQ01040292.1~~GHRQ01040292.1.p1  ORF type:complete len:121 (+),score=7.17 GHRQ01040292.1:361-723(+)
MQPPHGTYHIIISYALQQCTSVSKPGAVHPPYQRWRLVLIQNHACCQSVHAPAHLVLGHALVVARHLVLLVAAVLDRLVVDERVNGAVVGLSLSAVHVLAEARAPLREQAARQERVQGSG